ncbi:DUF4181 domain-containing protein [Paenibacillus glucanolyticus]
MALMEGLYSFMLLTIMVVRWILYKVTDVGEEEMRDTPGYKRYLIGSWILMIVIIALIWMIDRSEPYPLWPFLVTLAFCFRGYMEWKHIPEARRHRVSMILATISFSFTGLMILILLLKY